MSTYQLDYYTSNIDKWVSEVVEVVEGTAGEALRQARRTLRGQGFPLRYCGISAGRQVYWMRHGARWPPPLATEARP